MIVPKLVMSQPRNSWPVFSRPLAAPRSGEREEPAGINTRLSVGQAWRRLPSAAGCAPLQGCPVLITWSSHRRAQLLPLCRLGSPTPTWGSRADPDLAHSDPRDPLSPGIRRTAERFRLPHWSQLRPYQAGSSPPHRKMTPRQLLCWPKARCSGPWHCPLQSGLRVWFPRWGVGRDALTLGAWPAVEGVRKEMTVLTLSLSLAQEADQLGSTEAGKAGRESGSHCRPQETP